MGEWQRKDHGGFVVNPPVTKNIFFSKYHLSQNDTCHLEVDSKPPIVEPYLSKLCLFDLNLIT